jgi:hypothetical protein
MLINIIHCYQRLSDREMWPGDTGDLVVDQQDRIDQEMRYLAGLLAAWYAPVA